MLLSKACYILWECDYFGGRGSWSTMLSLGRGASPEHVKGMIRDRTQWMRFVSSGGVSGDVGLT